MIEVFHNLFVGSAADLPEVMTEAGAVRDSWFVISAAKLPWHKEALGHAGHGAPKDHPEYLIARRPNRLLLNLIDADKVEYIRDEIMDAALDAISNSLDAGLKVLVHCNQGQSRAPTIVLLWLRKSGHSSPELTFDGAVRLLTSAVYPAYAPAKGMADYARAHWGGATQENADEAR